MLLSSTHLTTLEVGLICIPDAEQPDWSTIDVLLGTPRFGALQRLSFTHHARKNSLLTAEVKALMPQATARNILK
jgi:hypothetical protein